MLDGLDPLATLRKAIRLHEGIAAREQAKGSRANMSKMAEAMKIAADLSVELAAIESRLGINSSRQPVEKIEVEYIATDSQLTALRDEAVALKARIAELESAEARSEPTKKSDDRSSLSITQEPPSADSQSTTVPAAGNNVVPISETREERILRLRRENGDGPQALRPAFADMPLRGDGMGRFDFPTNRGGW